MRFLFKLLLPGKQNMSDKGDGCLKIALKAAMD